MGCKKNTTKTLLNWVRPTVDPQVYDGPNVGPISLNLSVRFELANQSSQEPEQMALFFKLPTQTNMAATSATPESHVKLFAAELQFYAVLFPDMRGRATTSCQFFLA